MENKVITIPFYKPFISGSEIDAINEVFKKNHFAGDGYFTQQCTNFFVKEYGFENCLLTSSCTSALELIALLLDIQEGDEVIVPAYTFVTSANAFAAQGAFIIFSDVNLDHPQANLQDIERKITSRTRAIMIVHYAGYSNEIEAYVNLAKKYNLILIEDAAQCIHSFSNGSVFGSFGDFAAISFHETKNIHCGEGGLLVINNPKYVDRANVMWNKGTNKRDFQNALVPKYEWVDFGRSFAMSELQAAMLFSQLPYIKKVNEKRKIIWEYYYNFFKNQLNFGRRFSNVFCEGEQNFHIFYILCKDLEERIALTNFLKLKGIQANFHYQSLEISKFALSNFPVQHCPNSQYFSDVLLRLPIYYELDNNTIEFICKSVMTFFDRIKIAQV